MENKFRSICELCTAISFTVFGINVVFYPQDNNLYVCMCSSLIAFFTLLANRTGDKDVIRKGIDTGKYTVWSRIYRWVSVGRLWLETIAAGITFFLILSYFLTYANQGNIFQALAYYETIACIMCFLVSEWILFIISLILMGIEKIMFGQNTMNSLMQ